MKKAVEQEKKKHKWIDNYSECQKLTGIKNWFLKTDPIAFTLATIDSFYETVIEYGSLSLAQRRFVDNLITSFEIDERYFENDGIYQEIEIEKSVSFAGRIETKAYKYYLENADKFVFAFEKAKIIKSKCKYPEQSNFYLYICPLEST